MSIYAPKISEQLRERTASLAKNPASVVEPTYDLLMKVEGYKELPSVVKHDILESLSLSARMWFDSLLTGRPPALEEMNAFYEFGRRRVHQRVPLQSVLRAFRLGSREIWRAYIEFGEQNEAVVNELLFGISPYLFDYFDLMAQSIAQAYLEEQLQQSRWRTALCHQLYSIVFNSPEDLAGFRETAEAIGLDSTAPYVALAIDVDLSGHAGFERERVFDAIEDAAARHLGVQAENMVRAWHRGRLILWLPGTRGNPINQADRLLIERAGALARAIPEIHAIGLGLMNEGAQGWAISVDEATRALDFAATSGTNAPVFPYSRIVIEESARLAVNAQRYLVSLLEQLANEPDLLATLETYFEHGQRRGQSASALGIHPNTLNYRIDRIENLLGASLDDVSWTAKLSVALKLRRLSWSSA